MNRDKVVARDRLMVEARALLAQVLNGDQRATRLAKRAVNEGMDMPLQSGLELEGRLAGACWQT